MISLNLEYQREKKIDDELIQLDVYLDIRNHEDKVYFKTMFTDAKQAFDFYQTFPDCNGITIINNNNKEVYVFQKVYGMWIRKK
jgi:hypothetical protein